MRPFLLTQCLGLPAAEKPRLAERGNEKSGSRQTIPDFRKDLHDYSV
jgi:hypothetical protein